MMYMNRTTEINDQYLVDARNDIAVSYIIMSSGSSTQVGSYWTGSQYVNGVTSGSVSDDLPMNEYATVAVTSPTLSSGIIKIFNGVGKNSDALFGRILIYDSVLSASEVSHNHAVLTNLRGISGVTEGPLNATLKVYPVSGATSYALSYQSSAESETYVTGVESAVSASQDIYIEVTTPSVVYTLTLYVDGVSFQTETFTPLSDIVAN